jgi:UDP-glucose 4-epimerase
MNDSSISDAKILITGGAGFIGSTVARRLAERNRLVIFDDFSRDAITGSELEHHKNVEIVRGSVLDPEAIAPLMDGVDFVVHCAGIAGINTVHLRPVHTMRVNMVGSANVLEAASKAKSLQRIVCFSTSEVFGQIAMGASETDKSVIGAAGEARWTYAVSKLAEEHLTLAYHSQHKMPVTVVRPFNVYGPGQIGEGALKTFILRALRNETIEIHGDGTQIRAWCYVDDMVDATVLSLWHPKAIGEAFNIGNRRCVETIYGLANTVVRVLGSKSKITFVRKDYADVDLRIPSVSKADSMLGFEARVGLEEGIERTAAFYGRDR